VPHLIFEYTANLEGEVDFRALALPLHHLLAEKAGARLGDCKSRWRPTADFVIGGDEEPGAFVHLTLHLLAGRPRQVLEEVGEAALAALAGAFGGRGTTGVQLSVEVREMAKELYFKQRAE